MIEDVCSSVEPSMARVDYEVSLLRLLERLTNGTVIEISLTGALTPILISFAVAERLFG